MAVVASATGAAVFGLSGVAAGVAGGALLGAGAGALYSAVTKDGNILDSALTGGLIGGGIGGLGAAAGPALMGTAGGTTATTAASAAANATPALAATGANTTAGAALANASADPIMAAANLSGMSGAEIASMNAPATIPSAMSGLKDVTPMTGKEMLGYGLAGTAAMSLLGGMNQSKLSSTNTQGQNPAYIRPYTYSQTKNPNYGEPGESYYTQSYTAQPAYKAARGGIMHLAAGGYLDAQSGVSSQTNVYPQGNMYPQSQQEHLNFATPTQMPASAEVLASDYDTLTNPYTGEATSMADGGVAIDPNAQAAYVPAQVNPALQVGIVPAPVVGNQYTIAPQVPPQAVTDYNRLIASRANEEYVKTLPPANTMPGGKYGTADLTNQITQNYQDILGRAPDQAGLDYWLKQAQGGAKLSDIKNAFKTSNENLTARPEELKTQLANSYQSILGRAPDQAGLDYWTQQFQQGKSFADIQNALKSSQEYATANPATGGAVGGPSQADINAYLAANPTTIKTYNAATKTYSAPNVTQAQIDAWKASTAGNTDLFAGMDPAVLQTMYADYQRQQQNQGQGANGGLMPNSLRYATGGGISGAYNLGSYSDGGRLLKGPGDGVSDDIPAVIGQNQPARLAEGEFVIPARIVSELGNGSTDAGAKRLYAMMDKIQAGRKKTIGKDNVAKDTKAKKHLLA
jgi:hypothetical protein